MTLNNNHPFLVWFQKKNDIYCFPSYKKMTITFTSEVKNYENAIVIDSSLNLYEITQARKIGWGNVFWGFSLLWNERLIKIELQVNRKKIITIDEAKKIIIERVESKPFGKFMQGIFETKNNMIKNIQEVRDIGELTNLFLYDN